MGAFILQDAFDSEHKPFVTVWQGRDFKERRLLFVCSSHGIHGSMWIEHWLTGLKNLRLMSSCSLYDGRNDATSPKKRTVVKMTSQFCLGQKTTNTSLCSVFLHEKGTSSLATFSVAPVSCAHSLCVVARLHPATHSLQPPPSRQVFHAFECLDY